MAPAGRDAGWIGRWSPGIGDATLGGWLTVVAYAVSALLCWRVLRNASTPKRERRVWAVLAIALVALGINKQLDLQTALNEAGRALARAQGWYDSRTALQGVFIVLVAFTGLLLALGTWRWSRQSPAGTRVALLGFVILVAFVVIRAASFSHVDRFIDLGILGFRYNWLVENGGIGIVAIGACWRQVHGVASPD